MNLKDLKKEIWLFLKAQLSAQTATIVDFSISLLLAELFGLWYVGASFLGALSGGMCNCVINYHWVFGSDGQLKRYVAIKYLLVWIGSILLNTGGTYLLTEISGHHFIFAKAIVSVAVALLWNYQLQRLFVYKDHHLTHPTHHKEDNNKN